MSTLFDHLGVDVSKATLDCHLGSLHRQFANDPKAIALLIDWIKKTNPHLRVICEATGPYHLQLVQALQAAAIGVCVLNPQRCRDYAKSQGLLAKTDKIDAAILADFGNRFQPQLTHPLSPAQLQLAAALHWRNHLIEQITATQNQLHPTTDAFVAAALQDTLTHLQKQKALVQTHLKKLIATDPRLHQKVACLAQVQGVGDLTASCVLSALPELGSLSRQQVAALAGLAPRNRDSGSWHGKRTIGGGRSHARRALYMAALVASRRNPLLKAFYQRLISKGKAPKLALTALMRKLLIHLNSLLKKLPPLPA